jgi:hypothetical protein
VPPTSSDRIRRELRAGRETDLLLVWMVRNGIPVTRQEYINTLLWKRSKPMDAST